MLLTLMCYVGHTEIVERHGIEVSLRLGGKKVVVGEELDVVDSSGKRRGVIRITGLEGANASAEIESGTAEVGMRVARRKRVSVERKAEVQPESKNGFDFRLNPFGLVTGAIAANFDFKISRDWTVGLQAAYLHLQVSPTGIFNSNYNITAYGFGARANWFMNGAFKDGFYFGPSLEYLSVSLKTADINGPASGTAAGMMASGLIGYGWFWSGFNIMLGGGYATVLGASGITIKDSVGNSQTISASLSGLTYELSLGWAF